MSFDLSDYEFVADREAAFFKRHPDGSIQTEIVEFTDSRVTVKAFAYRTADDQRPGVGHSSLGIPGTTPYTRNSELENAETSAIGRALRGIGFGAKATRDEISSKQVEGTSSLPSTPVAAPTPARNLPPAAGTTSGAATTTPEETPAADFVQKAQAAAETAHANRTKPADGGDPAMVEVHFGKNQGRRLGDLGEKSVRWYAESYEDNNPKFPWGERERRLKLAAQMLCGIAPESLPAAANDVDDIPFSPVIW